MRNVQAPLFTPDTEWVMPDELRDLRGHKEIAIDLETNDPQLLELGSGNVVGRGHIAGIAVSVEGWSGYYPIGHEQGGNLDKKLVLNWLQDLFNQQDTKFIFFKFFSLYNEFLVKIIFRTHHNYTFRYRSFINKVMRHCICCKL